MIEEKKELSKLANIALSDKDVLKLLDGKAKVLTYDELQNYETLDEALAPYGAIFLLYETEPDFGHWTAVFKRSKSDKSGVVEFFDSYGKYPDSMLQRIPKNFKKISGQDYPTLSALLYYSPYKLEYNEYAFQKLDNDIQTCGRWAACRIAFKDLDITEFRDLFHKKIGGFTPDEIVTALTSADLPYK